MSDTVTITESKMLSGKIQLPAFFVGLLRVIGPPGLRLLGACVQFLSTVMIARQLGDQNSADFFFWAAVLTTFAPVATYGMEHLVLRAVPRLKESDSSQKLERYLSSVRSFTLGLSALIGVLLFSYAIFRNGGEAGGFQFWQLLIPVALGAMALLLISGEALKGLSHPVAGIFFSHFVPVTLFCGLIALNIDRLSSPFLIAIYSAAYVFALFIIRFSPSKTMRSNQFSIPDCSQLKTTFAEGFSVFSVNMLGALCYIIPLMILDFSREASEVAYVTTSFRISILFAILATAIHGVYAPSLSRAAEKRGNRREIWRVYRKTTLMTLLTLIVPFGVGIAFPDFVMSVFGEAFRSGSETLRLLLIGGMISLCLGPTLQLLLMTGNTKLLARLGVVKLILVSVLSLVLIPQFGGIGMVSSMAVVMILEAVTGLAMVARQLALESPKPSTTP
tara:strand:- start:833 stop:2173 length:1341 start_codon:yes stop_codon:yes gene_type:complete